MENKTQDQPKESGIVAENESLSNTNANKTKVPKAKGKTYDVFISYRRLTTKDEKYSRHSSCLARSIAQTLQLEGYRVFCDCLEDTDWQIAINKSKSYIVLCTGYSFDKTIKGGENYEEEIRIITKRIEDKNDKLTKNNVLFVNVENWVSKTTINENIRNIAQRDIDINVKDILTDNYSIDDLIKFKKEGKRTIAKRFPWRFSYKTCRIISWLFMFVFALLVIAGYKLYQYSKTSIIFAGGGTVQQYLVDKYGIDVTNYQGNRSSQYVHLPSTDAWSLLWDDATEGKERQYCPIILSTTQIDTTNADTDALRKQRRIIAEYLVDSIPFRVLVFDNKNDKDTITKDSLRILLLDTSNYEIWTTRKESGTYLEYKKLLKNDLFDLDSLVNNQEGGAKVFNRLKFDNDSNKTEIALANNNYYYEKDDEKISDLTIISDKKDSTIMTVPIYVYSIAENFGNSEYEILPRAKDFLNSIDCNADTTKTENDIKGKGIVIRWEKRKQ